MTDEQQSEWEANSAIPWEKRHRPNRPAAGLRQCPCWECGQMRAYGWL
jgi:hypothetical protein